VIDFYCLLIPQSGLRLKFQGHCISVDSVRNWLLWGRLWLGDTLNGAVGT